MLGPPFNGLIAQTATDAPQKETIKNESDANLKAMLLGNKDYHPQTWMEKGRVLYLEGKFAEAVQAFKSTSVSLQERFRLVQPRLVLLQKHAIR